MNLTINNSLLLILLFIGHFVNAQTPDERHRNFLKTTTLVILEDDVNSEYNKVIKTAMENVWTLTKYKYIAESEYEKDYKDKPDNFFIGKASESYHYMSGSGPSGQFTDVSLHLFTFLAEKNKKPEFFDQGFRPSGFGMYRKREGRITGNLKSEHTFEFPLEDAMFVLQYFQNGEKPAFAGVEFAQGTPNKKSNPPIHKKTLVLSDKEMQIYDLTEEKLKSIYSYPVKIVSEEEVNSYIVKKEKGLVYIRTPDRDSKTMKGKDPRRVYVVDAETGFPFYSWQTNLKGVKRCLAVMNKQ